VWLDVLQSVSNASTADARFIVSAMSAVNPSQATKKNLDELRTSLRKKGLIPERVRGIHRQDAVNHSWLLAILQGNSSIETLSEEIGDIDGLAQLVTMAENGTRRERNRALAVLALLKGISLRSVSRFLQIAPTTVFRYWKRYRKAGIQGVLQSYPTRSPRKAQRKETKNAVFSILHSPPSEHDINRTTWKMADLKACLAENGHLLSRDVIREVIKSAGYRWKKARVILTSPDPEYREKLSHIQSILSTLGDNDRFFSIDEFGPFSIKKKGGNKLVGPDDSHFVRQIQKSKGFLIVTSALELSHNQITHFYSWKKNTVEMLRLLHLLLDQYKGCRKLFFSWDAASWHSSKRLYREVNKVNSAGYRRGHNTALVELAPLPASAQFLNVIESVFSGMARAIIHNSNYSSSACARVAIDRYFAERNEHFRIHPKRAGKRIWGKEIVPAEFDETHNCKDPRW
jgi:transposase